MKPFDVRRADRRVLARPAMHLGTFRIIGVRDADFLATFAGEPACISAADRARHVRAQARAAVRRRRRLAQRRMASDGSLPAATPPDASGDTTVHWLDQIVADSAADPLASLWSEEGAGRLDDDGANRMLREEAEVGHDTPALEHWERPPSR